MGLFLVNVALIVGVLSALLLVSVRLLKWRKRQIEKAGLSARKEFVRDLAAKRPETITGAGNIRMSQDDVEALISARRSAAARTAQITWRLFLVANIATTLAALVPLGFAFYNLITNDQLRSLGFNLAALATLIVTKGSLFLLTWILVPVAKAVPGAIAGAVVKGMYKKWRKQRVTSRWMNIDR